MDGRELEGLEWDPNKPLTTSNEQIPIRVVSASDNTRVIPTVSPEKNLQFQKTKMVYTPDPGEIRPAMSVYEKEWKLHAASFENSLRSDLFFRSISTGGFFVTSYLFGGYVASDVLPYAMKRGEELYSVGLKIYNNPWGKLSIGAGAGWVGYKQDWSPDINFPDPIISVSSQYFQFFFSTLDKNDILFDVKRDNNSNINNKLLDYNAKSNQKTSKDQETK